MKQYQMHHLESDTMAVMTTQNDSLQHLRYTVRPAETPSDFFSLGSLTTTSWQRTYAGILPQMFLDNDLESIMRDLWKDPGFGPLDFALVASNTASTHFDKKTGIENMDSHGQQEQILGYVCVRHQDMPYVNNLHVHPSAFRRGIGRALMLATFDTLRQQGCTSVYLTVAVDNPRAIAFYKQLNGRFSEAFEVDLYGTRVRVFRVDWDNLDVFAGDCNISQQ